MTPDELARAALAIHRARVRAASARCRISARLGEEGMPWQQALELAEACEDLVLVAGRMLDGLRDAGRADAR
jgi:hypothetical protein